MRLKVFTARTIALAMDRVRAELGEDAVIVTVDQGSKGSPVRITAAVELKAPPPPVEVMSPPEPVRPPRPYDAAHLAAVLRYHTTPTAVATRLQTIAASYTDDANDEALGRALAEVVPFAPLDLTGDRPVLLAGLPGQGKTLTAARLAASACVRGRPCRIITLDGTAAGAMEQMRGFCAPLDVPVLAADSPSALELLCRQAFDGLTIIDTAGLNPYAIADLETLAHAIKRARAEPVWVQAAGTDALEAAEMADIFASLGTRSMIATRLDAARRLGALLTAPIKSRIALAGFSASPFLSDPVEAATPLVLAQLMLDKPDPNHIARSLADSQRPTAKANS